MLCRARVQEHAEVTPPQCVDLISSRSASQGRLVSAEPCSTSQCPSTPMASARTRVALVLFGTRTSRKRFVSHSAHSGSSVPGARWEPRRPHQCARDISCSTHIPVSAACTKRPACTSTPCVARPSCLGPAMFLPQLHQAITAPTPRSMGEQTTSTCRAHRDVNAAVSQFQASHIRPITLCTSNVSGAPVGSPFGSVHERHSGKPPRRLGRLATSGKYVTNVLIL
jgi:hypothetical protein